MTTTNRYHTILYRMLDDIQASDHLAQFVHWRRIKAHAILVLERYGKQNHEWIAYHNDILKGDEHQCLRYFREGIDTHQIKRRIRALKRIRSVHVRRTQNELRGRYDHIPLVEHGDMHVLDLLIHFYGELGRIAKSARPERFAYRSRKELERQHIDRFVRIAKKEQQFYGGIATISNRLGLQWSTHDSKTRQGMRKRRRRFEKATLAGLACAVTLAGAITCRQLFRRDALEDDIAIYIAEDHLTEDEIETRLERYYGVDIVGRYTQEDLANLEERLKTNYSAEVVRMLGLRRIVIVDDDLRQEVDYVGLAIRSTGEMRLFSGRISDDIDHEMAHFRTFTLESTQSDFVARWREVAGPYNHVKFEVGPRERGSTARNPRYIDGGENDAPRHGYIRVYGGVRLSEDVATFVESVRRNVLTFSLVTQDVEIYRRKLALLRDYRYIFDEEFDEAIEMLRIARTGGSAQNTHSADICAPDTPEAL